MESGANGVGLSVACPGARPGFARTGHVVDDALSCRAAREVCNKTPLFLFEVKEAQGPDLAVGC